jgi:uncharacterized protein (DUF433 family)
VNCASTSANSSSVSDTMRSRCSRNCCCIAPTYAAALGGVKQRPPNPRYFSCMEAVLSRITTNPRQCGGRPCIRGMRIRVADVLQLFAAGLSAEQVLAEMPDLEAADLQAALQYAARQIDYPRLAA